jgi:hypothetical protein
VDAILIKVRGVMDGGRILREKESVPPTPTEGSVGSYLFS